MTNWFPNLMLASMVTLSTAAGAADQLAPAPATKDEPAPVFDEQEFKFQKAFMIKDTASKIAILQTAHDCAKTAETPTDFASCNRELREAILGKK